MAEGRGEPISAEEPWPLLPEERGAEKQVKQGAEMQSQDSSEKQQMLRPEAFVGASPGRQLHICL